jgi:hypothetical protein
VARDAADDRACSVTAMIMKLRIVVVALTVLLGAGSSAQAQEDSTSEWSSTAAIAVGSATQSCGTCDGERTRAPSGYLRIGRAVATGLVLSGEVDVWSKSENWVLVSNAGLETTGSSRFTIATLNAVAQWYPVPAHGLFVDGGVGVGRYQVSSKSRDVGGFSTYSYALGYQAGVGYDIPVGSRIAVTPSAKIFGFTGAKVEGLEGKLSVNVAQLALGVTWH